MLSNVFRLFRDIVRFPYYRIFLSFDAKKTSESAGAVKETRKSIA